MRPLFEKACSNEITSTGIGQYDKSLLKSYK